MKMTFDTEVGNPTHGLVCAANAASFENSYLSVPMTEYAHGWRDPSDLQTMLNFLFPPVQTARRFEYRATGSHDDFLYDSDDGREVGADFKRVAYKGSVENSKTVNKGLTIFIDMDEVGEMPNFEQVYTARLLKRCVRNDLVAAITAFIAGATVTTSKNWFASAADPDADIATIVDTNGTTIGFNPNRLVFLGNAWLTRTISLRKALTEGAKLSIGLTTPDQVAQYVGCQRGMDVNARISTGTAKSKVGAANLCIPFYAEDGVGPEDPSHAKRFWTPCADGSEYRVYSRQFSEKLWKITVERYNRMVMTSTLGLNGITVTQA
jgi:hypothetical protein